MSTQMSRPRRRLPRRLFTRRTLAAAALVLALVVAAGVIVVVRHFQPRAPSAARGQQVSLVATGLRVPTSFAFGPGGTIFAGDASGDTDHPTGSVYVLRGGVAHRLPGSPGVQVSGLQWHDGVLYVSAGSQLLAWSGWNGQTFTQRRTLYTGPPKFTGFTGLAIAPDGRIWVGVLETTDDYGPTTFPHAYDILSFTTRGTEMRVVARGMRQPWQILFAPDSSTAFVSDLGQNDGADAKRAPDFVLRVRAGQNFGFPTCNWLHAALCHGFTRPWRFFRAHANPMGLGIIGNRLYVSEYGDVYAPAVISLPLNGQGPMRTVLTHFENLVVALAAHDGWLYVGDGSGNVYRVRP